MLRGAKLRPMTLTMTKHKSNPQWLKRHQDDAYVRRARREGWRSRAVFKLMELDQKVQLMRPAMLVLDLGAAPGGWSQYVAERINPGGRVVATDRLPMEPPTGVDFVQGDFQESAVLASLRAALDGAKADLVISDMAPNLSGMSALDQPRAMYLAELAFGLACEILRPGGDFLTKLFQGQGFDVYLQELRQNFATVRVYKPKASRSKSRETYALARNLKL